MCKRFATMMVIVATMFASAVAFAPAARAGKNCPAGSTYDGDRSGGNCIDGDGLVVKVIRN